MNKLLHFGNCLVFVNLLSKGQTHTQDEIRDKLETSSFQVSLTQINDDNKQKLMLEKRNTQCGEKITLTQKIIREINGQ